MNMADQFDQASDREMLERDIALAEARKSKQVIEPTGVCLECGEPVQGDMRWCCKDCRDDWQRWNPEA